MTLGMASRRGFLLGLAALAGCGRPKGKGFPGHAFVANEDGRSIGVVDLTSFSLVRQIRIESAPLEILAHSSRPVVYALCSQSILEIDASAMKVRRRVHLAASLVCARFSPDGHSIWALCREPHSLVRLPLDAFRPAERIRLSGVPIDFDLESEGQLAVAAFQNDRNLTLLDLRAKSSARQFETSADVRLVRFRSDGRQVIAGGADRMLTFTDVATGRTVARLPLPVEPANFCFKPDGGELYVTGPGRDAVAIVFPYTNEVGETILAGNAPGAMATLASPPYLFVANPEAGDLTVLDIDSRKLAATVHVGARPRRIVITPDKEYALVVNWQSGDLAVIRIAALRTDHTGRTRRGKMAPLFTMVPVGEKPVSAAVVRG